MKNSEKLDDAAGWEGRYRDKLTGWERQAINEALHFWLNNRHLQPGKILIPGCGRSLEPAQLAESGFDVTGLDFAPSAIAYQTKLHNLPNLRFEQADVLQWLIDQPADAVYEQTCLCALQPEHRTTYEQQLHKWLRPGGKLFALFMQTDEPGGPPFHCALDEMKRLFDPSRWQWLNSGQISSKHSDGKTEFGRILIRR